MIWSGGKGGLNQHIFKVTSKKYPRSFYYYQLIWYLQHFKMIAELRKTTMGHITQDHLKQSRIVIPPIEIVKALDEKLYPIQEKQILLHKQNQQLSELRDWLLPMLMNGQVTVRQAHGNAVKEAEESLSMAAEPSVEYKKG
jgi:type I restriction enzyme S subunit